MKVIDSDYFKQIGEEIGLVKDNERLLIIVSHAFIEMMVKALLDHHINNDLRTHHRRLKKLKAEKLITENQFIIYDWFRNLRNDAAHNPIFRLRQEKLNEIVPNIKDKYSKVEAFHLLSIGLISELWNKNLDLFLPLFYSELVE